MVKRYHEMEIKVFEDVLNHLKEYESSYFVTLSKTNMWNHKLFLIYNGDQCEKNYVPFIYLSIYIGFRVYTRLIKLFPLFLKTRKYVIRMWGE